MRGAAVYLGLGSNLGQREAALAAAEAALAQAGVCVTAKSRLYLTEPVGGPPQDWFLNRVVAAETSQQPLPLLEACLAIERRLGRERGVPNGPRTLDIDILFHGELTSDDPRLTLPHPRLHQRRFVLVPLCEIAPDLVHPRLGLAVRELLERCADRSAVVPYAAAAADAARLETAR